MTHPTREEAVDAPSVGALRLIAARATWLFHMSVSAYLLCGWVLPWPTAWWIYALGAPLIQLGWVVFNDHCWLSIIEAKLRGVPLVKESAEGEEENRVFVGELIESIIKRPVPLRVSNSISYVVLWAGFAAACYRIYSND